MSRTFSLAHLTLLECAPPELISVAAAAGYDHVSLRLAAVTPHEPLYPLIEDRRLMKQTKSRLADTGLTVLDVELVRLDPATEPERYLPLLEAGAELGASAVIVQLPDPERARAIDRFGRICDQAKAHDLKVVLEFVSWTETPDLKAVVDIVQGAKRDNSGILVDVLHFFRSGSSMNELTELPKDWFHFIHLCDAPRRIPATTAGVISCARTSRLLPGHGELAIGELLECMPEVPCSLEIPNLKQVASLGPEEYARRALAAARSCCQNRGGGSWNPSRGEKGRKGSRRTGQSRLASGAV